jgi:hypothetical protein
VVTGLDAVSLSLGVAVVILAASSFLSNHFALYVLQEEVYPHFFGL